MRAAVLAAVLAAVRTAVRAAVLAAVRAPDSTAGVAGVLATIAFLVVFRLLSNDFF